MTILDKNPIAVVAKNSPDYIQTVLDLIQSNEIVVNLRKDNDSERISLVNAHRIITPSAGFGWFNYRFTPQNSDNISQISFTSGTEGEPKGVLLSHNALTNVIHRLKEVQELTSDVKEYIGVPVYHSFGYGRCRLIFSLGGEAYIPKDGFDPHEISNMLSDNQINSLSAVPSQLRLLTNNHDIFGKEREYLQWIEIGSQFMSSNDKISLRRLFPNAKIVQHYGLTEASRTTLIRLDKIPIEQIDSTGVLDSSMPVKISQEGRICTRGSHLASALLINGRIVPLPLKDGWFETMDLGVIKDGHLFYLGREDNVINCAGIKISAEALETSINAKYGQFDEACICRVADENYGEAILLVRKRNSQISAGELSSFTRDVAWKYGIKGTGIIKNLEVEDFPKTDTGKILRKELAEIYEREQKLKTIKYTNHKEKTIENEIINIYSQACGISNIKITDSITTLYADSLSAVTIAKKLSSYFKNLPADWRTLTISELSKLIGNDNCSDVKSPNQVLFKDTEERKIRFRLNDGSSNDNPLNISFYNLIKEDFATHDHDFFSQGFWAIFVNRFGNWRMRFKKKLIRAPLTLIYRILVKMIQVFCGIKLDYTVKVGRRVKLEHFGGMILGACEIGDDVIIRQNTTIGIKDMSDLTGKPIIEKGVNIGAGAVIAGRVIIGQYSVIGPNTVVYNDVPPFSLIVVAENSIILNKNNN